MATWQSIKQDIKQRIDDREWLPGTRIPGEQSIAESYGCARATVNRALQSLADDGWLERRRKAGTWVKQNPTRQAYFTISIVREEVEQAGCEYSHELLSISMCRVAPEWVRSLTGLETYDECCEAVTVHYANGEPYCYEQRWLHCAAIPDLPDLATIDQSINEWLVQNSPYSGGKMSISSIDASVNVATNLGLEIGQSVLRLRRQTYYEDTPITLVDMVYRPGHEISLVV